MEKQKIISPQLNNFPIVGIGASAGALDTLEKFFTSVPLTTQYAFVVIQHLSPQHKSMMDELLARKTNLPIKIIEDNLPIEKGHIYLNPPKRFIEINGDTFKVNEQPKENISFPISHFFESLATSHKEQCAAIVVSGTGSDGSDGIVAIKSAGGLTIAQDRNEASFDGMPASAVRTGMVDLICATDNMYTACSQFFKYQKKRSKLDMNRATIQQIVQWLKKEASVDFSGYKDSTLSRRISRRMGILGIEELGEYYNFLKSNEGAVKALSQDLMVGVTSFFRDNEAFDALANEALPKVFEQAAKTGQIRVWVVACSTGEEAYSLAMLILEEMRKKQLPYGLTIFATDVNGAAIKKAGSPVFSSKAINTFDKDLVNTYFDKNEDGYRPKKKLRDLIVFSKHDVLSEPPFSKIDLLSCRNLLIYLKPELQKKLLHLFRYALRQEGILFLGSSETLGSLSTYYDELSRKWQIYRSRQHINATELPNRFNNELSNFNLVSEPAQSSSQNSKLPPKANANRTRVQDVLIQRYAPNALIYDQNYTVIYITGIAGKYLENKPGSISNNLLDLLPNNWSTAFDMGTTEAKERMKSVVVSGLIDEGDTAKGKLSVRIDLIKNELNADDELLFSAVFINDSKGEKRDAIEIDKIDINEASEQKIKKLEYALRSNKESLQSTIEELESSNEELQSSNEELQSSNEELESVNEELYTVNAEYQKKANELSTSNNDLNNLLHSTNVAILFLDQNLKIRRFTTPIKRVLNLVSEDIGRYIGDFAGAIQLKDYEERIREVMETLQPFETTVKSDEGSIYIMQATPFRTDKNEIRGVVLSMLDVTRLNDTELRLAETKISLQKSEEKYNEQKEIHELIEEHLSDLICVHDKNGVYEYVSPSAYDILGYKSEELIGVNPYELFHPDDQERIRSESHNQVLDKQKNVIEYRIKKADGTYTWFETTNQFITNSKGKVIKILTTSRDVSHRKRLEDKLKLFSEVVENTQTAVCVLSKKAIITYCNKAYLQMSGYDITEIEGRSFMAMISGNSTKSDAFNAIEKAIEEKSLCNVDIQNKRKDGNRYWVNIIVQPLFDSKGILSGFISVQQDITSKKEQEIGLKELNQSLESHNSKLQDANKELQDFAYIISHDLKEPVRGVEGLLGLIKDKSETTLTPKGEKFINLALDSTRRMNGMIDSLLEYSRAGSEKVKFRPINLDNVFKRVKDDLFKRIEDEKAEVNVHFSNVEVQGHGPSLTRLFQNLISNALKYRSKKDPIINVSAQDKGNSWLISVEDNGIGVEEKNKEKVFKLFNKVSARPKNGDSHGVGLAICKRIVKMHNGELNLDSEVGKGSTFKILLPKNQ